MRLIAALACAVLLFSVPASAQQTEKQREMQKGQTMFYVGLGVAATGLTPMFMGTSKGVAIGLPLVGGGSALAWHGYRTKKRAEARPTLSFGVVPLKKGIAFGASRSW